MGINLSKNETINLSKSAPGLSNVRLGLGWDAKMVQKKGLFGGTKNVQKDIDLDASAIMIGSGRVQEIVYYGNLTSSDRSIRHTGDNLTGAGDGDDESILVDLRSVPASVDTIVFTVNSFSGDTFNEIDNAYVRVVDSNSGDNELAKYTLTGSGNHTAQVMAALIRVGNEWNFRAIGESGNGRTASQIQDLALRSL